MADTSGWLFDSTHGSVGNTDYPTYRNKSGFTGLPGGLLQYGIYSSSGSSTSWWTSSEVNTTDAQSRNMVSYNISINITQYPKGCGYSVRCLRD